LADLPEASARNAETVERRKEARDPASQGLEGKVPHFTASRRVAAQARRRCRPHRSSSRR
jgi:hypothetical protein